NPCRVCSHPERRAIDEQLARRVSLRAVAEHWSLTPMSVSRHARHADKLREPQVLEKVTRAIRIGVPYSIAAQLVRVDEHVFKQALQQDEQFCAAVLEAE